MMAQSMKWIYILTNNKSDNMILSDELILTSNYKIVVLNDNDTFHLTIIRHEIELLHCLDRVI